MDVVGAFGCLGYVHAFDRHFDSSSSKRSSTDKLCCSYLLIDLIAVLCPFGPLKILVESSRNQNQEVPALLYTVNAVWFMASPPDNILNRETLRSKESSDSEDVTLTNDSTSPRTNFHGGHSRATGRDGGASISSSRNSGLDASFSAHGGMSRTSSTMALVPNRNGDSPTGDRDTIELRERARSGGSGRSPRNHNHGEGSPLAGRVARSASGNQGQIRSPRRDSRDVDDEEEHRETSDDDDDDDGRLLPC